MKLKCPACRSVAGADAWAAEVDVEAVLDMCAKLPTEVSRRVLAYLALFRPLSGRPMAWSTVRNHLIGIKYLIDQPSLSWGKGPARANNPLAWAAAMDRAISHPPSDLPLKSHNYLRKVAHAIAGEIERNKDALRIEAEETRRKPSAGKSNYHQIPICAACGMQANNIVNGEACPFCGEIA